MIYSIVSCELFVWMGERMWCSEKTGEPVHLYYNRNNRKMGHSRERDPACQSCRKPGMLAPTIPDRSHICRQFSQICGQFGY